MQATNHELTAPEGVVFGNAAISCLKLYNGKLGKVVVVSRDEDYFSLGKSIKDAFENENVAVSTIVFDDAFDSDVEFFGKILAFRQDVGLVVAVGNCEVINLARHFAGIFGAQIVVVPTQINFCSVFASQTLLKQKGLPKMLYCQQPLAVVIDLFFMAGLKKQAFADAFCEVASKLVALIDYECNCKLNNIQRDPTSLQALKAIESLTEIQEEGNKCHLRIINAELRLGLLTKRNGNWLFGSESKVAFVLNAMKEGSFCENAFFANMPIIKLYEAFLLCELEKCLVSPDYNQKIEQLASLCKISELDIIENYKPLNFEECENHRKVLASGGEVAFLKKCEQLAFDLLEKYKFVYKGRQKRAEYDFKQLKRAIKYASYLGGVSLLKTINDCGVCECLD